VTVFTLGMRSSPNLTGKALVHWRGWLCRFRRKATRALDCMTARRFPT
jgi:hypothetical protein